MPVCCWMKTGKAKGEVFSETIEAGQFIAGNSEATLNDFEQCWVSLLLWMNKYNHSMRKTFRLRFTIPTLKENPKGKMIVDFCIPIQ